MSNFMIEQKGRYCQIRYIGLPLPLLPQKMSGAVMLAMMDACHYWLRKIAPGHFDVAAYNRYGGLEPQVYEWRTKSKKNRGAGGARNYRDPLVWKGNLRRAFLTGGMVLKSSKSAGINVRASWPALPKYVYYTKYGQSKKEGPKMYRELTIMHPGEEKELLEMIQKRTQKYLDQEGE